MRKVIKPEMYFLPALAAALDQLAGYFAERGDADSASDVATESAEVQRLFAADENWETASEAADEYHDAADVGVVVSDAARDIIEPGRPSAVQTREALFTETEPESRGILELEADISSAATTEPPVSAAQVAEFPRDKIAMSLVAAPEGPIATETTSAKGPLAGTLEISLELKLSVRKDILWWILLGIMCAVAAKLWGVV
ncbi:hypothetical protein B0H19DRAFT_1249542 [Mycena capillaripes]|nr:hypothetical protein B0H19DRAFT_1249542 [Mycena capillaripes]